MTDIRKEPKFRKGDRVYLAGRRTFRGTVIDAYRYLDWGYKYSIQFDGEDFIRRCSGHDIVKLTPVEVTLEKI